MFKPLLVVLAGPNGSGKSSVLYNLLDKTVIEKSVHIDPDKLTDVINQNKNKSKPLLWRDVCIENGIDLIVETVLVNEQVINNILNAIAKSYFVIILFICTNNPSINIKRVYQRFKKGGKYVPPQYIKNRYNESISNCIKLIPLVNKVVIFDNSRENNYPIRVCVFENGKIKKKESVFYKSMPWHRFFTLQ